MSRGGQSTQVNKYIIKYTVDTPGQILHPIQVIVVHTIFYLSQSTGVLAFKNTDIFKSTLSFLSQLIVILLFILFVCLSV